MPTVAQASLMVLDSYAAKTNGSGQAILPTGYGAPVGWTLTQVIDHTASGGDYAAVFVNNTTNPTEVFIAGRGTAQISDALPDANIVVGSLPTSRITDASNILATVQQQYPGAAISAGGHSLDGEVWAQVSEQQAAAGKVLPVLAEDAPSTFTTSAYDTNVLAVSAQGDIVGHFCAGYSNSITLDTHVTGIAGGYGYRRPRFLAGCRGARASGHSCGPAAMGGCTRAGSRRPIGRTADH